MKIHNNQPAINDRKNVEVKEVVGGGKSE